MKGIIFSRIVGSWYAYSRNFVKGEMIPSDYGWLDKITTRSDVVIAQHVKNQGHAKCDTLKSRM